MGNKVELTMPAHEYHAHPALNNSGLTLLERSPLHFYAERLDPSREAKKETAAMKIGSAIHAAILEPAFFESEYRIRPTPAMFPEYLSSAASYKDACRDHGLAVTGNMSELRKRLQDAKSKVKFFDDLEAEYQANFTLLSEEEMGKARGVARRALVKPQVLALFSDGGHAEPTFFWTDEETGVECRARADWVSNDGWILDLKSTEDARPERFIWSIKDYHYHRQAAWYLEAYEKVMGKPAKGFIFGALEKAVPYESMFYLAGSKMIEKGRTEMRALRKKFAECKSKNEWPGYPEEINPIEFPEKSSDAIKTMDVETF